MSSFIIIRYLSFKKGNAKELYILFDKIPKGILSKSR